MGPDSNDTLDHYWTTLVTIIPEVELAFEVRPWIGAVIGSALVGLSGLIPLFILPNLSTKASTLKFLLSFAVGGLLGDTFLHLLPEAYEKVLSAQDQVDTQVAHLHVGFWVLVGIFMCIVIEMIFNLQEIYAEKNDKSNSISVAGYLNLVANITDNFNHGLAIGGGFLISNKIGFITTGCILIHEIPHEMGDFAILLKSGFSYMDAAKAQFSTAFVGILGASFAFTMNSIDWLSLWILPFTAGGFINIALVSVLPDLMHPKSIKDCILTLAGITLGITAMAGIATL